VAGGVNLPRKKKEKAGKIEYFIDEKPSSLLEVVENNPDDTVWKSFLEQKGLQGSNSAKRYLKGKIGDYLSAGEISKRTDISTRILDKWRKNGSIEAEMLKGRWYYSLKSVINAIKTTDIKDLR
jgi:hypothetical protein